jgi:hypothetical protein
MMMENDAPPGTGPLILLMVLMMLKCTAWRPVVEGEN